MFTSVVVLSALVPFVAAFAYPDFVPLEKRQQPGTPQYDCHADCGAVITAARTENYCDSSNFTASLDNCLNCANEYNIWQYYGESVTEAAEACELDATPVAANSTESASADATVSTTTNSETATEVAETSTTASDAESSIASEVSESGSESAASATSDGAAAAETSSEDDGFALSPGMAQLGLVLGAAILV